MKPIRSSAADGARFRNSRFGIQHSTAFTLLELLVVITILGILAALTVPALKNLGKSNVQVSASRQLLDDVGYARQLAISQHTTVYMVFVPSYFWNYLPVDQQTLPATINLLDKQFTGYGFLTMRSVGDQPGQGVARYIGDWKSLPDGAFIATNKFYNPFYYIYDYSAQVTYTINPFNYSASFPFPTATNFTFAVQQPLLPYIAFNYLGQLIQRTISGQEIMAGQDEYIPLAQGTVGYVVDAQKNLQLAPPDPAENPPGNSTNSMFTLVHIDRLTGRATLVHQKVQ